MGAVRLILTGLVVMSTLAGCARNRVDSGPDEFSVIPRAALSEPASYSELPNPGGEDTATTSSFALASAALGGTSAQVGPTHGAGAIRDGGGGFLLGLIGGNRTSEILNPDAEAARLSALGLPVIGGN